MYKKLLLIAVVIVGGSYNLYGSTIENSNPSELIINAITEANKGLHDFMYMDLTLNLAPAVLLGSFGLFGFAMSYECLKAKNTTGILASNLVTLSCVGCVGYSIYTKNQRTHEITKKYFSPIKKMLGKADKKADKVKNTDDSN